MPPVLLAGVDVGGTRTKAVLVADREVVGESVVDTPEGMAIGLGAHVKTVLAGLGRRCDVVGVVVPGLVQDRTGLAVWSANLGWRNLDVAAEVSRVVGIPVTAGHDVRAGLLGEATYGAGRDCDDVLFVALGTGVASALLSSGRVVAGSSWTGEVGHVRVETSQARCGCGARGCLEAVVGARALARRWGETTGRQGDAAELAEAVAAGEQGAVDLWDEAVQTLAGVLATAVAVAGVERVVVGGGLSNAGEVLLQPLRQGLADRLPGREIEVVRAALGDRAAALGAAELARTSWTKGRS